RTPADYENLQLNELPSPASGNFAIRTSSFNSADLSLETVLPEFATDSSKPPVLSIAKKFFFGPAPHGCEVSCDVSLALSSPLALPCQIGIESIFNFLAPNAVDRFFETSNGPQSLRFSGALPAPLLRLEDGWQRVRATLHAPGSQEFWIAPI